MISSLTIAGILIGLICYWWSTNYFSQHPLQLSLLISLFTAMLIPIFSLLNLRNYYTSEGIKELTDQPKTPSQLDAAITYLKQVFRKNKFWFLIPLLGFTLLFFYLNKGVNLISIVYDNSESMQQTTAVDALSETFDNLQENNEISLTTLEGLQEADPVTSLRASMKDLMLINKSSELKAGNVVEFNSPQEAKNGLTQVSNKCVGSPICEGIWKTYLHLKESAGNKEYKNKLLIIITDGLDNVLSESLKSGKFFFDDNGFAEYFTTDKVFIIDYSNGESNPLFQRFQNAGCDIYNVENNKQAYLNALDNALQSFKNNWNLIYWTIFIFLLLSIIALLIQPKKII